MDRNREMSSNSNDGSLGRSGVSSIGISGIGSGANLHFLNHQFGEASMSGLNLVTSPANPGDDLNKRKPNFTESEKFFLVRQYEANKHILSSRQVDINSNKTKSQVWRMITDELNRRNTGIYRTPGEVRKKWQNLVTLARKEIKEAEVRGTPIHVMPWLWRKVVDLAGAEPARFDVQDDDTGYATPSSEPPGYCDSVGEGGTTGGHNISVTALSTGEDVSSMLTGSLKNEPPWEVEGEISTGRPSSSTSTAYARKSSESQIHSSYGQSAQNEMGSERRAQSCSPIPRVESVGNGVAERETDPLRDAIVAPESQIPPALLGSPGETGQRLQQRPLKRGRLEYGLGAGSSSSMGGGGLPAHQNIFPPSNMGVITNALPSGRSLEEMIVLERWDLEKRQKLQEMDERKERFELEKKKLIIETEILELEKEKQRLELQRLRFNIEKETGPSVPVV